jgi:hypothetical protein
VSGNDCSYGKNGISEGLGLGCKIRTPLDGVMRTTS